MSKENPPYSLVKIGIFQCHVSFQGCKCKGIDYTSQLEDRADMGVTRIKSYPYQPTGTVIHDVMNTLFVLENERF